MQKKKDSLLWFDCRGNLNEDRIKLIHDKIGFNLPKSYISYMKKCNGGKVSKHCFDYYDLDLEEIWTSGIGCFLSLCEEKNDDFLKTFQHPPEFFPEGLIAFAENGGGDFICFDYRNGKDNPDPPVVYWNHEADVGKDVSFVAKNFEEFLEMLKEPEDIEV